MVKGRELFDLLVELTGLEEKVIRNELEDLLKRLNVDPDHLTTDQLREVVSMYLEKLQNEHGLCERGFFVKGALQAEA